MNVCILGWRVAFGVLFIIHLFGFSSPLQSCILLQKLRMVECFKNENMISKIACEVFTNPIMEKKCLQKSKSKKSKKNNEKKY